MPKRRQHTSISIRIGGGGFFKALISQRSRMEISPMPAPSLPGEHKMSSPWLRILVGVAVTSCPGAGAGNSAATSRLLGERWEPCDPPGPLTGVRRGPAGGLLVVDPEPVLSRDVALGPPHLRAEPVDGGGSVTAGPQLEGTETHSPMSWTSVLSSSSSGAASVHSCRAPSDPPCGVAVSRWSFTAQTAASSCCRIWSSCSSIPGGSSEMDFGRRSVAPSISCLNTSTLACSSLARASVDSRAVRSSWSSASAFLRAALASRQPSSSRWLASSAFCCAALALRRSSSRPRWASWCIRTRSSNSTSTACRCSSWRCSSSSCWRSSRPSLRDSSSRASLSRKRSKS
mmetsp:Transcript_99861/g.265400  ORF Transcript_99861/g.265400 Transcript_99861/m.265400 type:complete len:344 (-) Transcript_99861:185-1216(-)